MDETTNFSTGKLFPMILKYSIPAAISLLITAIYNIVDRIFVGNFNGTSALAGLSICFPLSYMMMAFGLTCSAGGSSLFSLFAGKGERKNMNRSFGNSLLLAVIFEILYFCLSLKLRSSRYLGQLKQHMNMRIHIIELLHWVVYSKDLRRFFVILCVFQESLSLVCASQASAL